MGYLIKGRWTDDDPLETGQGGDFQRIASACRGRVTADGSSGFKAEAGRYHLYVGYHCPWAHRTILYRSQKGLKDAQDALKTPVVNPQAEYQKHMAAGATRI